MCLALWCNGTFAYKARHSTYQDFYSGQIHLKTKHRFCHAYSRRAVANCREYHQTKDQGWFPQNENDSNLQWDPTNAAVIARKEKQIADNVDEHAIGLLRLADIFQRK